MEAATLQPEETALSKAEDLADAIEDLEEVFAPLLELPLSETLQQLDLLQGAKLEVSLAYAIHDLLWMYLKCKGVDANEHPVARELSRLKAYFRKIKDSENPPAPQRQLALDKNAASRFINHALSAAQKLQDEERRTAGTEPYQAQDVVNPHVFDGGRTTMLKWMPSKAKKLDDVQQNGDEDEDSELEMVDGEAEGVQEMEEEAERGKPSSASPAKGESSKGKGKGKRGREDPFAGYDGKQAPSGQPSKKKKKKTSNK
ncbi:hypothetical protein CALVIDRAFT_540631 [Calocera viscosa TUFC12733]|uniref:Exosome complex protein n=1 Tax=Calocera viscosa (strain TUFC12733) TaxID=1330018 RepID=A0A167ILE8_CALVF|nr:hypothetical protein CALVIDRAFT_540631 [Calocera viscosa TUFC12733]